MNQSAELFDQNLHYEEKISVFADEVLKILKELSHDNRKQIDSKLIADKMFWSDPVKKLLSGTTSITPQSDITPQYLRELSTKILDRFSELVPSSMIDNLDDLKGKLDDKVLAGKSTDWLDSPIQIIKKYIDSISVRNNEMESFIVQTMQYLGETERQLSKEVYTQQKKYSSDRQADEFIYSDISSIKKDFDTEGSIDSIRNAVLSKIGNINKCIKKRRDQDIVRLKQTEDSLKYMNVQIEAIRAEAEEMRRKAREMQYESFRDNLTGLFNRKAYDQRITETLANLDRYNVQASLLICDIDFFKNINDTFGHKVGDLALVKIASLLKKRLRTNDYVARYGGEEFVAILPHTDLTGAEKAGEGIREYIDEAIFSYKGKDIPLTVSVGISTFREGDDSTRVFERADTALYFAKRSGRNMVMTENDVPGDMTALNETG